MSDPSLPQARELVPPTMGAGTASSSPPLRRDPDDDDDEALEEGELRVPVPVGHESSDSDDTEDGDDDGRSYLIQPRVEYDREVFRRRQQHRSPRHRLDALDIHAVDALPSPTPSGECESDSTLSDHGVGVCVGGDDPTGSSSTSSAAAATAAADAVGLGWAATGKRGWKAGGNQNKKPHAEVVQEQEVFDLNTVSATGEGQAAGTTSSSAQAAPAAHHHHQQPPPLPTQAEQPPRAPQPRRKRERATEYTCKECGKSYPNNQALGGHAAGHRNKQREAEAMAAAVAAGVEGGASLAAVFPLRHGGGKADKPHECRRCGKVFASGVALGGHMRVHYTGPPIVPARKNKKRCLAPPPPTPTAEGDIDAAAGLSLAPSIKAEENIAVAAPPVAAAAAAGRESALSIKTEQESPSTPPPAVPAGAVRVVLLFGKDISAQVQQQGSGGTTEDSSSTGQQQH